MEHSELIPSSICQVCNQNGDGKRHYGAMVCRACAAFFRRSIDFKTTKKCKKNEKCDFLKKGFFNCKFCRLQKCYAVGMTAEHFQFQRDMNRMEIARKIPQSMDVFCGKSNLIIFRAPHFPSAPPTDQKNFIDLQFLLNKAEKILRQGPEAPVYCRTRLDKLAYGLNPILRSKNVLFLDAEKYRKEESLGQLEHNVLTVTKWLTYFDDFQKLPQGLQIQMLQGIYNVWWKLEQYAASAMSIKQKFDPKEIRKLEKDYLFYSYDSNRIDMSWVSKYSVEELKFFMDIKNEYRLDDLTRAMIELDPSDVELSFMLGQLCFHYVGKRYQGKILEVVEKFQEILANDLHDHYVNQMKQPYYMKRLSQMMKINNQIQREIYEKAKKTELALVFDIFCVQVSHPEMFMV